MRAPVKIAALHERLSHSPSETLSGSSHNSTNPEMLNGWTVRWMDGSVIVVRCNCFSFRIRSGSS